MVNIDILMATYNGEFYIENQLLSLIGQTYKNWILYIHDDGSCDDTLSIIKKFQQIDSRIILIEDKIKFGNAGANFLHLLQFSKSDYIIFCDQDDIWFESKLEVLYNDIKKINTPAAVYCNAYAYDGVKIISNKVSLIERDCLSNSLFLNSGVQGCSLMFNKSLRNLALDFPEYIYMHDHYITMLSITFGKLIYIDKSLMLYRQHNTNVTGNVPKSFKDRLNTFFSSSPIIDRNHYKANKSLYENFKNKLTEKEKKIYLTYLNFPDFNLFEKIIFIYKYNFRIGKSKLILVLKLFIKKTIN